MPLNHAKYRPYLDDYNLTDDQKTQIIDALWSVAEASVDLAFGVDAISLSEPANDNVSDSDFNVIELMKRTQQTTLPPDIEQELLRLEAANDNNK